MDEHNSSREKMTAPNATSPAWTYLQKELASCEPALVSWESGLDRMRDGQGTFDATWSAIIRNAARLYGRAETRAALEAMSRPEDVSRMY